MKTVTNWIYISFSPNNWFTTHMQVYLCVPSWPEITFLKLEMWATSCPSQAQSSAPVWPKCWSMRETTCAINAGTCSPCRLHLSSFIPSLHPPAAPMRMDVILSNSPACQGVTPLRPPARTTRRSKSKSRWGTRDVLYSGTVTLEQPPAEEIVHTKMKNLLPVFFILPEL